MNAPSNPIARPDAGIQARVAGELDDEGTGVSVMDALTWLGQGKRLVSIFTATATAIAIVVAVLLPSVYTARTTLLPPGSQQQSGSAAALAALGSLGGLAGGAKSPDELYVSLLQSDSVIRGLDHRFNLKDRYDAETFEQLRKMEEKHVKVTSDKKSGVLTVEVDDKDPMVAANIANAHAVEVTKVLARLAVTEAQQRRVFFDNQLTATKERLVKAEQDLKGVQQSSGVIMLDKQSEALISNASLVRAKIAEREVQLKVLRTGTTAVNPDVQRLGAELAGLKSELTRIESSPNATAGSAVDIPIGNLPEASIEYIRARREVKLQESLLESMVRQLEIAKLDEAKEGSGLQVVDLAMPPERKSKPWRSAIVLGALASALIASSIWVVVRGYFAAHRSDSAETVQQRAALSAAWRVRRAV